MKAATRANKGPPGSSANNASAKTKNSLLGETASWSDIDAELAPELWQHTRVLQDLNLSPKFCSGLLLNELSQLLPQGTPFAEAAQVQNVLKAEMHQDEGWNKFSEDDTKGTCLRWWGKLKDTAEDPDYFKNSLMVTLEYLVLIGSLFEAIVGQVFQEGPSEGCTLTAHEAYETQLLVPDFNVTENPHPCTKIEQYEWILWSFSLICFGVSVFVSIVLIALVWVQPDGRSLYSMLREKWYYNMVLLYPAQMCLYGFFCMNGGFILRQWHTVHPNIAMSGMLIITIFFVTMQIWAIWMHHIFFNISFCAAVHQFYVSWGFIPYPPSKATNTFCGSGKKVQYRDHVLEDSRWTEARLRRHSAETPDEGDDGDSGANAKDGRAEGEGAFGFAD